MVVLFPLGDQYHRLPRGLLHRLPHIESGGRERISLRHSSIPLKIRPTITARPCHHRQPPPIILEDLTCSGDHALTFQDLKEPGPFQGIIHLVQFQEFHAQELLPQGR